MYKIAVAMNPIETLDPTKDSTFSLMNQLQIDAELLYIIPDSLVLDNKIVRAKVSKVSIDKLTEPFYKLSKTKEIQLNKIDAILFRVDPPVNDYYLNIAHILGKLEERGILVINSPSAIRLMNEKILGDCYSPNTLPSIISNNIETIERFVNKHKNVVVKPLNMMAGKLINKTSVKDKAFKKKVRQTQKNDPSNFIIVQKYIDVQKYGDMRIILYNGEVYERGLLRFPKKNEFRSNLAQGGNYKIKNVDTKMFRHLTIVSQILKNNGIYFAGVDVIDKFITEINITSPTGLQEIDGNTNDLSSKVARSFLDLIDQHKS